MGGRQRDRTWNNNQVTRWGLLELILDRCPSETEFRDPLCGSFDKKGRRD